MDRVTAAIFVFGLGSTAVTMVFQRKYPDAVKLVVELIWWCGLAAMIISGIYLGYSTFMSRLQPTDLINGGIVGAAIFSTIALGGLIWQYYRAPQTAIGTAAPVQSAQPQLSLIPPAETYELTWNPPSNTYPRSRPASMQLSGSSENPIFSLVNNSVRADEVSVEWQAVTLGLEQLFKSSFADFIVSMSPPEIVISYKGVSGTHSNSIGTRDTDAVPSIVKKVDVKYPWQVWNYATLYIVGALPDEPGGHVEFTSSVTISWNGPDGGIPKKFLVKAVATNIKPKDVSTPLVLASVRFEVEPLN
jgi:hypothetical protein